MTDLDGCYAREFLAGRGTMDFNSHMANTACLDLAADVRMTFFAEHGLPPGEFRRLAGARSSARTSWSTSGRSACTRR